MDNIGAVILAVSLIIIMFGMGLSLVRSDFTRIFIQPKPLIIGSINQLILLPLIGYLLCVLFKPSYEIAIGIMLLSVCPGGPTSNFISYLSKGDTALSITLTVISSIITVFTIPLLLNYSFILLADEQKVIHLDFLKTFSTIFIIVILPTILGMLVKSKFPDFASRMDKPVRITSAVVFILVIVGIILKEKAHITDYFGRGGLITLTLNVLTMAIGYITSMLFLKNTRQAITISIESGIQNGTLAITIAIGLLGNSLFAIAPAVYSIIMFFTSGFMIYYGIKVVKTKA